MKIIAPTLLSFFLAYGAAAQTLITETEEQYTRSQAARTEAITAYRAGDIAGGLTHMKRALAFRPTNVALLANAIFLAAEAGDTTEVVELGKRYASLGLSPGAAIEEKMQSVLRPDDWSAFQHKFTMAVAPHGEGSLLAEIPPEHALVEGITTDAKGAFFLSTVVSGSILKLTPNGKISVLVDGKGYSAGSFFGLAYSPMESSLYVTYGRVDQTRDDHEDGGNTGVLRIDPASGDVTGNWFLQGGTEGQQIADVAINRQGDVFVTQAQNGGVFKVEERGLTELNIPVTFHSPQGLAFLDDQTLIVADYGRGLWYIDTKRDDALLLPVPESVSLIGIDGLIAHQGRLIAIQNGVTPHRIVEITLGNDTKAVTGVRVLAQNLPQFDEPTLGVSSETGLIFVASSQWPKYGAGGVVREGQIIAPTKIVRLVD